jgi:hypothetical protein
MKLVGARAAEISAAESLPGKVNYFIGNDPKKWMPSHRIIRITPSLEIRVRFPARSPPILATFWFLGHWLWVDETAHARGKTR